MNSKIYINADDFGLDHDVNLGIVEAFKKGYVTSTTLMVNMPGCDEAVNLAKQNGFWDKVGLHLNLYEGKPLNPNILEYKEFANAESTELLGDYRRSMVQRFVLNRSVSAELKRELEAQIQKFVSYHPQCMHVDSHGHSHTNWSVWKQCKPLFLQYGFDSSRVSRNLYIVRRKRLKEYYKDIYNKDLLSTGMKAADFFGNFTEMMQVLQEAPEMLEGRSIELMCHPKYENGHVVNSGSITSFEDIMPLIEHYEFTHF